MLQMMHLDWRHACSGKGCCDGDCELCMCSPTRRCSINTKPKYASGDYVKSVCEEAPEVVLLDSSSSKVWAPSGTRLQIAILDNKKVEELLTRHEIQRDDKQPDGPLLSSLFNDEPELLQACVVDRPLLKWNSGNAVASVVLPFEGNTVSLARLQCVKPYRADPNTKQSGQTTKYRLWIRAVDDQGGPHPTVTKHIISDVFTLVTTRSKSAAKSLIPKPWENLGVLDGLGADAVKDLCDLGTKMDAALGLPEQLKKVTTVEEFWLLVSWINEPGADSQKRQQQLINKTKLKQADFRNASVHVQHTAFPDYRPRVWWHPGTNNTAGLLFACDNSETQLTPGPIARVVKRPGQPDEIAALQPQQLKHPAVQGAVKMAVQAWQERGHGGSWGIYWCDGAANPWTNEADPWARKALAASFGTFSVLHLPAGVVAAAGAKAEAGAAAMAVAGQTSAQPHLLAELFTPVEQQHVAVEPELLQQQPGGEFVAQQQLQQLLLQSSPWPEQQQAASYPYRSSPGLQLAQQAQHQQGHYHLQQISTQQLPTPHVLAACTVPAFGSAMVLDALQPPANGISLQPNMTAPMPASAATLSTVASTGAGLQLPSAASASGGSSSQQAMRYSRAVITEAPRASAPSTAAAQGAPSVLAVQAVHTAAGQAAAMAAVQAQSSAAAVQAVLAAAAATAQAVPAAAPVPSSFMALLTSEEVPTAPAFTGRVEALVPLQQQLQLAGAKAATPTTLGAQFVEAHTAAAAGCVAGPPVLQLSLPPYSADTGMHTAAAAGQAGHPDAAPANSVHLAYVTNMKSSALEASRTDAAAICSAVSQATHHDDNAVATAAAGASHDISLGDLDGFSGGSFQLSELLQFEEGVLPASELHLDSLLAGDSLFDDSADQQNLQPQQEEEDDEEQHQLLQVGKQQVPVEANPPNTPAMQQTTAALGAHGADSSGSGLAQSRKLTRATKSLTDYSSKPSSSRQPVTALQRQKPQQQQQQQLSIMQHWHVEQQQQQQQLLDKKRDRKQRKEQAVASTAVGVAAAAADGTSSTDQQQQQADTHQALAQQQIHAAPDAAPASSAEAAPAHGQPAGVEAAGRSSSMQDRSLGLEGLIGFEQIINQGLLETMASTDKQEVGDVQQGPREGQQQQHKEQQQAWQGMGFNWPAPPGNSGPDDFTAAFPASLMGQAASYLGPANIIAGPLVEIPALDEEEGLMGLSGLMSTLELEHAPPTRKARA